MSSRLYIRREIREFMRTEFLALLCNYSNFYVSPFMFDQRIEETVTAVPPRGTRDGIGGISREGRRERSGSLRPRNHRPGDGRRVLPILEQGDGNLHIVNDLRY